MHYSLDELASKSPRGLAAALEAVRMAQPKKTNYYDRAKGLKAMERHILGHLPDLLAGGKAILDVGPGVGYFIELATAMGNTAVGIDATASNRAQRAYQKVTKCLGLEVSYTGFHHYLEGEPFIYPDNSFDIVQFRGSLDAVLLSSVPPLARQIEGLYALLGKILRRGGRTEIFHNITPDVDAITKSLQEGVPPGWKVEEEFTAHTRLVRV